MAAAILHTYYYYILYYTYIHTLHIRYIIAAISHTATYRRRPANILHTYYCLVINTPLLLAYTYSYRLRLHTHTHTRLSPLHITYYCQPSLLILHTHTTISHYAISYYIEATWATFHIAIAIIIGYYTYMLGYCWGYIHIIAATYILFPSLHTYTLLLLHINTCCWLQPHIHIIHIKAVGVTYIHILLGCHFHIT